MKKARVQCRRCGNEMLVGDARVEHHLGVLSWVHKEQCGPEAQAGKDGVISSRIG